MIEPSFRDGSRFSTHTAACPPDSGGLRAIDADTRQRAESSAIEADHERRLRMALRNRRQRELYGPKHQRRRREFARRIERGELFVCPRCEGEIRPDLYGIWATATGIPHGHARSTEPATALPRMR